MRKHVFLRIVEVLTTRNECFKQRPDATGRLGASGLQKCTTAIRLLAYDTSADSVDDYLRISASLARDSLQHFVEGVVSHFSDEYLRRPTETDLNRLLFAVEQRGFPGRCNDINVLDRSPLFNDVFEGRVPPVNYVESLFAQHQEGVRKDVERAFGVLQARFAIVRQPALARDREMLGKIIIACIIIHNMIVEDERDSYSLHCDPNDYEEPPPPSSSQQNAQNFNEPFRYETSENRIANLQTYMTNRVRIHDKPMHDRLKADLVENIWMKFGETRLYLRRSVVLL
ncbi:uncharacterized protein LOC104893448 [Beta vulgaris subsp. vulgaris]|uniref:uncharacterized protein LOC104893448 n=1 Tax=Beta vulgaris subsp. vulgaris TaxID=3555 RepID=UPI00053F98D1|nr:uncharacterized protein LOC104893448 [Beta vulgaris subsp. vulgaris]